MPALCAVCADAPDDGVPLLACEDCGIAVHHECYLPPAGCRGGAPAAGTFRCQTCADASAEPWSCTLCGHGGGAAFVTAEGAWVHGVCALYVRGVSLQPDAGGVILVAHGVTAALERELREPRPSPPRRVLAPPLSGASAPVASAGAACELWRGCKRNANCVRTVGPTGKHAGMCKLVPGGARLEMLPPPPPRGEAAAAANGEGVAPRARAASPPPPIGAPTLPAKACALGTVKQGVDGKGYRVEMGRAGGKAVGGQIIGARSAGAAPRHPERARAQPAQEAYS